jgi:hypothetical protein
LLGTAAARSRYFLTEQTFPRTALDIFPGSEILEPNDGVVPLRVTLGRLGLAHGGAAC